MTDFNPFASLDKSRFRKDENQTDGKRKAPKVRVQQVIRDIDPEDEEALFLNAVGQVKSLDASDGQDAQAKDAKDKDAEDKDALAMKALMKDALKKVGKGHNRNTPDPKPVQELSQPDQAAKKAAEAANFSALVNLTLPSSAHDKRPAKFREDEQTALRNLSTKNTQNRRDNSRDDSREAVSHTKEAAHDAAIARLASPDNEDLFLDAMGAVTPLSGRGREVNPETPLPVPPPSPEENPLQDFMDGKLAFTLASTDEYVEGHVVGLDLMLVSKLQNGQFSPEGHIDLHGLNTVQAFQALLGFMRNAYMKGNRTVLVVPGRGKNSPMGMGVLREKIQEWFTQEPFRRVILAFCTARSVDGGTGAMYVLLRKFKKTNGKVYWDKRPTDPDLII